MLLYMKLYKLVQTDKYKNTSLGGLKCVFVFGDTKIIIFDLLAKITHVLFDLAVGATKSI